MKNYFPKFFAAAFLILTTASGFHNLPLAQDLYKRIVGKISYIDEDNVTVIVGKSDSNGGYGLGASTYQIEFIRMPNPLEIDEQGNKLSSQEESLILVSPQPTNLAVGDVVNIKYKPKKKISFEELLADMEISGFSTKFNIQRGEISSIDGVIVEYDRVSLKYLEKDKPKEKEIKLPEVPLEDIKPD